MKKILISILFMAVSIATFAQLKVFDDGKVDIYRQSENPKAVSVVNTPNYSEIWGQDSDEGYAVFVDSTHNTNHSRREQIKNTILLSTIDTIKSRKEKFKGLYASNDVGLSDGILHCLRVAMDLWEDRIENSKSIHIFIKSDCSMDADIEIKTVVKYSRVSALKSQPSSLYYQSNRYAINVDTIVINANVDWDYSWAYDINGGNDNLVTAFLRHIGHILGFGTSVTDVNGQAGFCIKRTYSDFDNLIFNSQGQSLSSLARNGSSSAISSFLSGNIHLSLPSGNHKLYSSPNGYVPYRSGMYYSLSDDNIMNYPYGDRTRLQNINKETLEALQAIGWSTTPYGIVFNAMDLNAIGYGSNYKGHTFTATNENGTPVLNANWKFQQFHNSTKQYVDVSTCAGSQIIIGPQTINNDCIDAYNCLQGRVVCTVTSGGVSKDYTMPVFLELAPELDSCKVTNIETSQNSYYYSCDIKICCLGNSYGSLSVCNEYGQTQNFYINGSGETVFHVSNILKYGRTYLDITLNNNYGSNSKIIYLDDNQSTSREMAILPEQLKIACERNNEPVSGKITVNEGDNVIFYLTDGNGTKIQAEDVGCQVQWYLRLFKFGNKTNFHELPYDSGICLMTVNTALFDDDYPIREYYVLTDGLYYDGSVRAVVRTSDAKEYTVDYPVRLDLLPKIPTVKIIDYREVYDEFYDEMYPVVELEIMAERFREGIINTTRGTWLEASGELFDEYTPMPHRVIVDWGSLGCGYNCQLGNEYGNVECEYVYPDRTSDVANTHALPQVKLVLSGGDCIVESDELMDIVEILDAKGVTIAKRQHVMRMSTHLTSGLYVVRFMTGGKSDYRKIIVK